MVVAGVGFGVGGVLAPATVIGTRTSVVVLSPVISSVAGPPGVPAGTTTSTEAVPYSSRMSVLVALLTGNDPNEAPLRLTCTAVSFLRTSAGVVIASEVRSNATCPPSAYVAGALARELDADGVLGVVHRERRVAVTGVGELRHVVDHRLQVGHAGVLLVRAARQRGEVVTTGREE